MSEVVEGGQAKRPVSRGRRVAPWAVLVIATLATAAYKVDAGAAPTMLAGPMVNMPAQDRRVITWAWTEPESRGWVELKRPDGSRETIEAKLVQGRYHATIDRVEAGKTYEYTVQREAVLGRHADMAGPFTFAGTPARGSAFRFVVFGDSGNGSNTQAAVARLIAKQKPDLIVHVGDLVYPAGVTADYAPNFYEPNAEIIRSIPFMPVLGNHDVATEAGKPLLREFVLPDNGPAGIEPERNYWFDFGDARFIGLDTNLKQAHGAITHEEMKTSIGPWMKKALTECDASWKFVYFHHPFYTGSAHSGDGVAYIKDSYLDVMESAGVDVVFWGHNHLYERIGPMWHDKMVERPEDGRGILYITTGAGGASRYPELENAPAYVRTFNDDVFSFTLVELSKDRLALRQISETGETIDEVVIEKKGAPAKLRAEAGQSRSDAKSDTPAEARSR